MYYITVACILSCIVSDLYSQDHGFIASSNGHILIEEGNSNTRYSPCSTFKIAISLMGFYSGILLNTDNPQWEFSSKESKDFMLAQWKQDHTPTMWFKNSYVWYSQKITERLGIETFTRFVNAFNYGNKDVSGDPDQNNGLSKSWLSSSLQISVRDFLQI